MSEGAKILLVEQHAAFRQALARVLEREPGLSGVLEAGSLEEARALCPSAHLCVMELNLPDGSGLDLIPLLLTAHDSMLVLVLTGVEDEMLLARAVEAGAAGVLSKHSSLEQLLEAVRRLNRGEKLIDWRRMSALVDLAREQRQRERDAADMVHSLTPREREVLCALVDGLSDKAMAGTLRISVDTVRTHLANVFSKLQVESRLQAVLFALRHGVVQLN